MKKTIVMIVILSLCLSLLAGCSSKQTSNESAKGSTSVTFRMSQVSAGDGAIGQSMDKFASMIEERTNGRYRINTFHNGQLGGERDNIEGTQLGTIDIAVVNQAPLSNFVPEIGAVDIPYLITGADHADNIFLGEVGDYFLEELSKSQIKGLAIWESGFRNLTNSKRPVNSVSDVAGLRIRTMENKTHQELWRSLGADPVPMAWSEAYTALQQKAIDGQENPSTVIDKNNVAEVNKEMAITEHAYSTVFIIMSPKAWDSLSDADQKIFKETAVEAGILERELSRKMEVEALENLKNAGVNITYPDKQEFIDASESFRAEYVSKYPEIITKIEAAKPQ